jgi:hypothetical protein
MSNPIPRLVEILHDMQYAQRRLFEIRTGIRADDTRLR